MAAACRQKLSLVEEGITLFSTIRPIHHFEGAAQEEAKG